MSSPHRTSAARVFAAVLAVALPLSQLGCHAWMGIRALDIQTGKEDRDHDVRLCFPEGTVVIAQPYRLDYPWIQGLVISREGTLRGETRAFGGNPPGESFDLEKAQLVELRKISGAKAALVTVGSVLGGVMILMATKASCPFVYVDEGKGEKLVGEGYPGAVFRSLQREDLLPLAVQGEGALSVRLANWAPEIQYTDRLELMVVDHPDQQRALATLDAHLVLAGPAHPPLKAQDLEGRDTLAEVFAEEGRVWHTNLAHAARIGAAREGLEVTFPPVAGRPVLELTLETTRWLEVVINRYFALMGDGFEGYLRAANAAAPGPLHAWRQREGVDLKVEARRGGRWETLGWVPATGAVALRRVAVPFPPDWVGKEAVEVRVSGGSGFWRVEAMGLSALQQEAPGFTRIAPTSAQDAEGVDQRSTLAQTDANYQVLATLGATLETRFTLPRRPEGQARTVFLALNGYYNPLAPLNPEPSATTVKRVREQEGALARFSQELYRRHAAVLQGGSR